MSKNINDMEKYSFIPKGPVFTRPNGMIKASSDDDKIQIRDYMYARYGLIPSKELDLFYSDEGVFIKNIRIDEADNLDRCYWYGKIIEQGFTLITGKVMPEYSDGDYNWVIPLSKVGLYCTNYLEIINEKGNYSVKIK